MSLRNWIAENIMFPSGDLFINQKVYKYYKLLDKSQWWSLSELENYQNERLRLLIRHAYANVPYYKKLFQENKLKISDIKSIDDLYKIPILTKEIIRKNKEQLIAQNISKDQ